jgi:hypothetical protein
VEGALVRPAGGINDCRGNTPFVYSAPGARSWSVVRRKFTKTAMRTGPADHRIQSEECNRAGWRRRFLAQFFLARSCALLAASLPVHQKSTHRPVQSCLTSSEATRSHKKHLHCRSFRNNHHSVTTASRIPIIAGPPPKVTRYAKSRFVDPLRLFSE